MSLLQITIPLTETDSEIAAELLNLVGALSISFLDAKDNPIYEPPLGATPLWDEVIMVVLFENTIDSKLIIDLLEESLAKKIAYQVTEVAEDNWQEKWQQEFKPNFFGRLCICPTYTNINEPDKITVQLDPGLAFGTGSHPTTALCLDWLAQHIKVNETVIDFGCGSGILAIAASKLGAKPIYAFDNDPQALLATKENAMLNQIDLADFHILLPEQLSEIKTDVLIANILANPLIELAPILLNLLKPNSELVLSGILAEQANAVISAYKNYFETYELTQREDWVRIYFKSFM